jgi:hypothetical protein
MGWYVVSYDLRGNESEEAYERVGNALRSATDWCKPLLSHWIVETPLTPTQIVAELLRVGAIDDDDGIVILETTMRGQYRRIGERAVLWLRQRVVEF